MRGTVARVVMMAGLALVGAACGVPSAEEARLRPPPDGARVTLDGDALAKSIGVTLGAVDPGETRYAMAGLCFEFDGKTLTLCGTNGRILAADARACDAHIANLRRKVERTSTRPERIVTVRGIGYKLATRD